MEGSVPLPEKLKKLEEHLNTWAKTIQERHGKKKKELTEQLERLNEADPKESILANIMEAKLALNIQADKEELYWAQRERSNWLKFGDYNTTYFHPLTTRRSKRNKVTKLENESGVEIEREGNLQPQPQGTFKNFLQQYQFKIVQY